MQPVFKYSPEKNALIEQPTMEKPVISGFSPLSFKEDMKDIDKWNKHIASLRTFCTHFEGWGDDLLIEGKDFEVIVLEDGKDFEVIVLEDGKRKVAIRLYQPEQEEDQDKLWMPLILKAKSFSNGPHIRIEDLHEFIKDHIIKRK